MIQTSSRPRTGLSLLEVIVSLAILLFSLVALRQLVNFGSERAMEARFYQQAGFLCQSKLAEYSSGILPLSSQGDMEIEDGGVDWIWSSICEQNPALPGLWQVQVEVWRETSFGQRISVVMSQMIIDPSIKGSTFDSAPERGSGSEPPPEEPAEGSSDTSGG